MVETKHQMIYLDENATAPLLEVAHTAMLDAARIAANPSSVHQAGRKARAIIDQARQALADLTGRPSDRIIFTASGSEANALAVHLARQHLAPRHGRSLWIAACEHASLHQWVVLGQAEPIRLGVDGKLDLGHLEQILHAQASEPAFFAIQAASGETGIIQDISTIAAMIKAQGFDHHLHVDAVQIPGKLPLGPLSANCDSMALSAHKMGGLQGSGALVLGDDSSSLMARPQPMVIGGGQEQGWRAGTENLTGIAAMGAATNLLASLPPHPDRLCRQFEADLCAALDDVHIIGAGQPRLPNTSCIAIEGVPADMMVIELDQLGFMISAGSACASGKAKQAHVLEAMGLEPHITRSAFRISTGRNTNQADLDKLVQACVHITRRWRS
ncbi:MAG: cysteine desulfurase family protein [Pseudomonadota bacterium]